MREVYRSQPSELVGRAEVSIVTVQNFFIPVLDNLLSAPGDEAEPGRVEFSNSGSEQLNAASAVCFVLS